MDEQQIFTTLVEYLEKHHLQVKRLQPDRLTPSVKCPDFEVVMDGKIKFYIEVKSPKLIANKATNMFHYSTLATKLRDHIHKAVTQFADKDAKHEHPWVLVFTSNFMQLNWTSMLSAISGRVMFGNKTIADLTHLNRVKETDKDTRKIDVYIWLQMNTKQEIIQMKMYPNPYTGFSNVVSKICTKLVPTSRDKSFGH